MRGNHAVVRVNGPSTRREAEPQPTSIRAPLLERGKQFGRVSDAQSAARILDLDQHPIRRRFHTQRDRATGFRELDGVPMPSA